LDGTFSAGCTTNRMPRGMSKVSNTAGRFPSPLSHAPMLRSASLASGLVWMRQVKFPCRTYFQLVKQMARPLSWTGSPK
jgi:hypothetical protein